MPDFRNERETEAIVRRSLDASCQEARARCHEQNPANESILRLLAGASKSALRGQVGAGRGMPDFTVEFDGHGDFVIVIECKANIRDHEGSGDTAEGGAKHYARAMSRERNVLAIAVSGQDLRTLRVSHFWHFKGEENPQKAELAPKLLPLSDYLRAFLARPEVVNQDLRRMMDFARSVNDRLHGLSVREAHRSLLISAILLALRNKGFVKGYLSLGSAELLMTNIQATMFSDLESHLRPETLKAVRDTHKGFMNSPGNLLKENHLMELVSDIKREFDSFQRTHEYYDLLGRLYVEFLRYSNSDKGLGIVLTPPHITELAAALANAGPDDVAYDNCAGTGGFLVAAMKRMTAAASGDARRERRVKEEGLVGVEFQQDIAALLTSNMFIHGDGRSNVIKGDCFSEKIQGEIRSQFKPTVGFLNPPFRKQGGRDELVFVLNNLETLRPGGKCVALLPMVCAVNLSDRVGTRKKLLEHHTLESVISMPHELFYNNGVGVVTCLMTLTAHQPHPSGKKTWFAVGKDDGFAMIRHLGRQAIPGEWDKRMKMWTDACRNLEEIPGFSVLREVGGADEWCAEAYISTTSRQLKEMVARGIPATVGAYAAFKAERDIMRRLSAKTDEPEYQMSSRAADNKQATTLPPFSKWRNFPLADLFGISGTKTTPPKDLKMIPPGDNPYVTTQATNNGVGGFYARHTEDGGVITVDSAVLGYASFQPAPFSASDHVEKLTPRFEMSPHLAMFLVAALNGEQFRYSYGRKASQTRLAAATLRLPADGKKPDFALMEAYVRTLPFSRFIG